MGLNHITIAAVIALLGAPPVLHAESADQADNAPATAPAADPALDASPIAVSEPVTHPADVMEEPAATGTAEPMDTMNNTESSSATRNDWDTLTMPETVPTTPATTKPIKVEVDDMPGRGASMAQVEKRFGQPREKLPPVGEPPITRWVYGDYTVYFEHQYVIHSVTHDAVGSSAPATPASAPEVPASEPQPAAGE